LHKSDFLVAEERAFGALSRWFRRARSVPVEWRALIRDLHLRGSAEECVARGTARTAAVLSIVPGRAAQGLFHCASDFGSEVFEEEGHSVTPGDYEEITQRARQQVMALVGSHESCTAPASALMLGDRKVLCPAVPWESICCVKLAYKLWCERHDSLKRRRDRFSAFPRFDAYVALPPAALQRLLVSDFEETVRVLSEHRSRKAMSPERLAVALGVDPSFELAGAVLPPIEGGHEWWIVNRIARGFPLEACSQRTVNTPKPVPTGRNRARKYSNPRSGSSDEVERNASTTKQHERKSLGARTSHR